MSDALLRTEDVTRLIGVAPTRISKWIARGLLSSEGIISNGRGAGVSRLFPARKVAEIAIGAHRTNKLGVKGVYMERGLCRAEIRCNGKRKKLGRFATVEAAAAAYEAAAADAFGEFYRAA